MWASIICLLFLACTLTQCAPQLNDVSMVVSTTESPKQPSQNDDKKIEPVPPKIYQMDVRANVSNRFVSTLISSRVKNLDKNAQEATFSVVLPETAYISGFVMEVDGKSYEAYVKEKEEAKQIYDQAIADGLAAGHVAISARDSNRFTVSLNVEPESKAVFHLKYEELLKRSNERYEVLINLHPGQPVADLSVEVVINETRPLKFVKAPSLRSGNEISKNDDSLDPKAEIENMNEKSAIVRFKPDITRQKEFAKNLNTKEDDGLAGQFVVQYDVERDPHGGEVLVQDGYFVHFFAPTEILPLPKLVIFVLDTSGSMDGIRIKQLKEAMESIISDLHDQDAFHIVEFGSYVKVWNVQDVQVQYEKGKDQYSYYYNDETEPPKPEENQTLPSAFQANESNKQNAKKVVEKLNASGGTDIRSALEVGLSLIDKHKEDKENDAQQPMMIFLTDGEPTVGEISTQKIIANISELNEFRTPIFSLSFGDEADREFLQKISLNNEGFARHIYEAADASLQLEEFYSQISSPLLRNVKFEYVNGTVAKLTRTVFPILFSGAELVVSGRAEDNFTPGRVFCGTTDREISLEPVKIEIPVSGIERIWAYLTIKQVLDEREIAEDKTPYTQRALDIALKYSFVTPVTSLVVVKPNDTKSDVNTEDASKMKPSYDSYGFAQNSLFASADLSGAVIPLGLSNSVDKIAGGAHRRPTAQESLFAEYEDETDFSITNTTISVPASNEEKLNKLLEDLPWIGDLLTEDKESIKLPNGTVSLGVNATVSKLQECPKTPLGDSNGTGDCVRLLDCPDVYSYLKDLDSYILYSCDFEKYAGVCCPRLPVKMIV